MVHGLATVALTTVVGGAMAFMARRFEIDFLRPVHSGDTVRCTLTITALSAAAHGAQRSKATRLEADAELVNQEGVAVARVRTKGVIPRALDEVAADDPRARL
jgi:acyl dehydratase